MYIEDLIELLKSTANTHCVQGVKIYKKDPSINHLLFADVCIIFYKANVETNRRVQEILYVYELASGQKINTKKTEIVFSHNVPANYRNDICLIWSSGHNQRYEKYLAIPPIIGR